MKMNRSFENIFEKYNVTYKLPKKRKKVIKKPTQSTSLNKTHENLFTNRNENSDVNKTSCSINQSFNRSIFINKSTNTKYCSPTRYNTLDVIPVDHSYRSNNCSGSDRSLLKESLNKSLENWHLKENYTSQRKENNTKILSDIEFKRINSICSFNLGKRTRNKNNYIRSTCKQLITTVIPKNRTLNSSFIENDKLDKSFVLKENSPGISYTVETPTSVQETLNNNYSDRDTSLLNINHNKHAVDWDMKENIPSNEKYNTVKSNIVYKRKLLSCSFNLGKSRGNNKNHLQNTYLQLNTTVIARNRSLNSSFDTHNTLNETLSSLENITSEPSQIIENPTPTPKNCDNTNTELDLLIDLIEQQNKQNNKKEKKNNDILPTNKSRCRNGGYEEMFQRVLKRETVRGNFLKHDRKFGLRMGKLLTVIKLETLYDITLAIVKSEHLTKHFGIIVRAEMVSQLTLNCQIEAFFDENSLPYTVEYNTEFLEVYLEPYKLLVV